jgi:hypothetical protein
MIVLDKGAVLTKNNKWNHLADKTKANRLDYYNTQKILNVTGNGGMHSHFSCVTLSLTHLIFCPLFSHFACCVTLCLTYSVLFRALFHA